MSQDDKAKSFPPSENSDSSFVMISKEELKVDSRNIEHSIQEESASGSAIGSGDAEIFRKKQSHSSMSDLFKALHIDITKKIPTTAYDAVPPLGGYSEIKRYSESSVSDLVKSLQIDVLKKIPSEDAAAYEIIPSPGAVSGLVLPDYQWEVVSHSPLQDYTEDVSHSVPESYADTFSPSGMFEDYKIPPGTEYFHCTLRKYLSCEPEGLLGQPKDTVKVDLSKSVSAPELSKSQVKANREVQEHEMISQSEIKEQTESTEGATGL